MAKVVLTVTDEQKAAFEEAAQKKGLPIATWGRLLLLESVEVKRSVGKPKVNKFEVQVLKLDPSDVGSHCPGSLQAFPEMPFQSSLSWGKCSFCERSLVGVKQEDGLVKVREHLDGVEIGDPGPVENYGVVTDVGRYDLQEE